MNVAHSTLQRAAFDVIGRYNQDSINGFSPNFIETLLDKINPQHDQRILELMGGDGNLSSRIAKRVKNKGGKLKQLTLLEYSRVQSEFARMELEEHEAQVIWGDVLGMRCLADDQPAQLSNFDKTVIKSSNHEIPYSAQQLLYNNVYSTLASNGEFVNLGFLFDDAEERDEIREIARVKDSLAKMDQAVQNRHFLTRDEYYNMLKSAGFVDIKNTSSFLYCIQSRIISDAYFNSAEAARDYDLQFQAAQIKAIKMRQQGRILFERDSSLMYAPGEITTARRPSPAETSNRIFTRYPYELVKQIGAHRELLSQVMLNISKSQRVLDLGCGIGLLAERISGTNIQYDGIDLSSDFVNHCRESLIKYSNLRFRQGNMNDCALPVNHYDAITLINSIYVEGVDALKVLEKATDSLRSGGVLVISGPTTAHSYINAEPHIRKQLTDSGLLPKYEKEFLAVSQANSELLTGRANYWSVEGMSELLRSFGLTPYYTDTSPYYGNAYLVCARKE